MSFIPEDKAYDVCITIYFSVSELVVSVAIAKIDAIVDSLFSDVRVMFSHRNEKAEINSRPAIHFNELDMSEVELSVFIRGPKKFFTGTTIIIPKKTISKKNNYYIVRPLLNYTKEDLIKYDKSNNIKYYIDKSNSNTQYTRNRIRKNILPILKEENPNIHKSILKYSETLLEYNDYINREIDKHINNIYIKKELNIDKFNKLDNFIKKNILYKILNNIYNNKPDIIKEKNIIDILDLINNNKPNIYINLPKDKICIKEYNKLYFKDKNKNKDNYKIIFTDKFELDNIIIEKIDKSDKDGNDICRLNSKNISLPLYIRNKNNGEYIEIKGLNGKKKIKDIFIDKKIPKDKRDNYPLLVDSKNNILWVPNIKKSKFNTKKDEFCDIILKYCERKDNNE